MLVPLSWLRDYVQWDLSTTELAELLTLAGLEVEATKHVGDWWDAETLKVGEVVGVHPHPQADRLVLVDVMDGADTPERVVTGAPNLFAYREAAELPVLKVAFARAGAELVDAYAEARPRPRKRLKASKIRGIRSRGMVCSELELGLSEEHEGIFLLPEDAPVGMPLREYLREEILELDLTPDMARCLSMLGVAREVSALTGCGPVQLPPETPLPVVDTGSAAHDLVDLAIDDPDLCPRYVAAVVRGVTVGPSPTWMQQRLARAGMRPINNIVDITNYVMLEMGQPLHAFDYDLLVQRSRALGDAKPCIRMRTARADETIVTLDSTMRTLAPSMLLITDQAGPIAIAGVMGGAETEVSAETRTILIESATFDGINNRRTAQSLHLHSEASHRFTRGVPAALNPRAAARAATLMCELAGGRIAGPLADAWPRPPVPHAICLTASEVNRQLGMALTLNEIQAALHRLDIASQPHADLPADVSEQARFGLQRTEQEPVLVCTPPWHRLDLRIPADLTEEVARIIGYDQVGLTYLYDEIPVHPPNEILDTEDRIRDILAGIGLQETIGYSYTSRTNHEKLSQHADSRARQAAYVELANPYSPERSVMRRDLLVSALESLAFNLRYAERQAAFEIGLEYHPDEAAAPYPRELRCLQLVMTGPRHQSHFEHEGPSPLYDYYDLKGVLETLFSCLHLDHRIEFQADQDIRYGPYCARIELDGTSIGLAGELHPSVRRAWSLPDQRIAVAKLAIAPLVSPAWTVRQIKPISAYPPVIEDLAFQVDIKVPAHQVASAIRTGGGALLTRVELFDLYQGTPLPPDQKSLAYRVTYQSPSRNLGEKETSRIRRKIAQAVARAVDGRLRTG